MGEKDSRGSKTLEISGIVKKKLSATYMIYVDALLMTLPRLILICQVICLDYWVGAMCKIDI